MKKSIISTVAVVCVFIVGSIIISDKSNVNVEQEVTESRSNINICSEEIIETIDITEEQTEDICSYYVTDEEYNLLLRVCMSECGGKYGEPLEGKIAVVETILNRSEIYGKTIEEVVYEPNQYSVAYNGEPDEMVREAVDIALSSNTYPDDMIYFRAGYYHSFGTPYKQIGNHYFSLKGEWLCIYQNFGVELF